ncbi:hypothetical protein LCGC14_2878390 [marine sediment metagenome]|uniref:Cupin type-2 domain-containing protein n=1 Tax=marine sediment metagenome TaxID=412755 RepID=A0A0F9A8Z3_9ZZZZ
MKVKVAEEVAAKAVEMDGASGVTMRMLIGPDDNAPTVNMRMFDVAPGGHTPRHSHPWEHEVFILAGEGTLRTAEGDQPLGAGNCLLVPGGDEHQFANTSDAPLRFLCLVPRDSG